VILYELLTGAWPFGDPSSPDQILQRFRARNADDGAGNCDHGRGLAGPLVER
jgi:hypothetical protein